MSHDTLPQAEANDPKRLQVFVSADAYHRIHVAAAKRLTGKAEIIEELALKHLPPAVGEGKAS